MDNTQKINKIIQKIQNRAEIYILQPKNFQEFCRHLNKYKKELFSILRDKEQKT